jgi:hypothetical protein
MCTRVFLNPPSLASHSGLHSSTAPPIPPHVSVENQHYLNAFHQTSWPGFVSYPRTMGIFTPLRMLEVHPSPIFNSEHKSSGVVVRTCNGVSTDSGPWRSITENFGHDDLQFATCAYRRYVVEAVEPEISSGDSICSCV